MLTPKQQDLFERIVLYCDQFTNANFIPVLFVLGESVASSSVCMLAKSEDSSPILVYALF